jgi:hypothetical protein
LLEPEDEGTLIVNNIGSISQHGITSQKTEPKKLGSNVAVHHSSNKPMSQILKFNSGSLLHFGNEKIHRKCVN